MYVLLVSIHLAVMVMVSVYRWIKIKLAYTTYFIKNYVLKYMGQFSQGGFNVKIYFRKFQKVFTLFKRNKLAEIDFIK